NNCQNEYDNAYSEFFEIDSDDEYFIIKFDNDSYLQALSSLDKKQDDFILQSDAEEEDTDLEQEVCQKKELSQIIEVDSNKKLTSCVLIDNIDGKIQICDAKKLQ
ncbi:5239_t:CDS:1, partial [Funneliformis caledonium]